MLRIFKIVAIVFAAAFIFTMMLPANTAIAQINNPNTACILCHDDLDEQITFPSGETLDVQVDMDVINNSVHGLHAAEDVYCVDCHADRQQYQFPHEPNPADSIAEFTAEISENCERCHVSSESHNPGHLQVLDNPNIPDCADCHGGHDVEPAEVLADDPIEFCLGCHEPIGTDYINDLHSEFIANMAADQTCESCHNPMPRTLNDECVACHSLLSSELVLESGDTIDLHVDPTTIVNSVHGNIVVEGVEYGTLDCVDCHTQQAVTGFPHEEIGADSRREFTLSMETICQDCHQEIYENHRDGVHQQANEEGNLEAATCFDCHGNHDIQDPDEPRTRIIDTCEDCHQEVTAQYVNSVHGNAVVNEDNPDSPVCTDCHGVHMIEDPNTARFRIESPDTCGGCHGNDEMMERNGISTHVFETYVADFHGTTVTLFEKQSPDELTNKAVCYDCHGIHNILAVNDENSRVLKENLLDTCQECHPDADVNFPDSWMGHYKPSLERYPLVYIIDLFYDILIPTLIGGMLLFVGTDVFRTVRNRRKDETEE